MSNQSQHIRDYISDITALVYQPSSEHFFKVISTLKQPVWLDSGKPKSSSGRFDILSANPKKVFAYPANDTPSNFTHMLSKYVDKQKHFMPNTYKLPDNPFWGGLIGHLDYTFRHTDFKLPHTPAHDSTTQVGFYDWALVQDHKLKTCHLIFMSNVNQTTRQHITTLLDKNASYTAPFNDNYTINTWCRDQSEQTYYRNLEHINNYIHQGDTYQVNYTQRFSNHLTGNPAAAYLTLRKTVPSPFSAYLGLDKHAILSTSPEQFIGVQPYKNSSEQWLYQAKTQPIKGTAKRSKNPKIDTQRAQTLRKSRKNQSENVMIVDLLRNDFSQNCLPNSVQTPKLFSLESYANVHHLVSTVTGTLKPSVSPLKFMTDCFPGGSITGAPKKRAMEIIHELETHSRQIYCGSVFYLSVSGHLDSNILIRSMLYNNITKSIYCWGGGGIVADSNAPDEYQESLDKVNILMQIL